MSAHHPPDPPPDQPSRARDRRLSPLDALARVEGTSLADFFSGLPGSVWMTDDQMVLTFVQGAVLHYLDVEPSKLVGRTLQDLLLDGREDHPLIQGHLTALAGHETGVRIEWGGNLYNARIAPLRDAEGRVVGCVGLHQQIGWLPDDDSMMRESDIRLRRVIDENMIGIVFGDGDGRITDANDAFLQIAGCTREDLIADGLSWPALTPVEWHQRQIAALEEIAATGRCTPFDHEIIRKDGRRVPVVVSAARLSARRREGVAFVLDVSERKQTERRLRAELAAADALAQADTLDDAGHAIVQILGDQMDWDEAVLWQRAPEGQLQLVARYGAASGDDARIDALAERATRARRPQWIDSPSPPALAVPFVVADKCFGVLVLVSRKPGGPDAVYAAGSLTIAERIAKFLARRS